MKYSLILLVAILSLGVYPLGWENREWQYALIFAMYLLASLYLERKYPFSHVWKVLSVPISFLAVQIVVSIAHLVRPTPDQFPWIAIASIAYTWGIVFYRTQSYQPPSNLIVLGVFFWYATTNANFIMESSGMLAAHIIFSLVAGILLRHPEQNIKEVMLWAGSVMFLCEAASMAPEPRNFPVYFPIFPAFSLTSLYVGLLLRRKPLAGSVALGILVVGAVAFGVKAIPMLA